MTIRRQYTLPNCNLILEGMSGEDALNPQAPMTVLLNAECQFPGISDPLVGGRDFLEALIAAVSRYAQCLLSGVPVRSKPGDAAAQVSLAAAEGHRHCLTLASQEKGDDPSSTVITLTTVQLFDLMEAIDQLLADGQTLPNLSLNLASVPRRDTQPQEPLVQRAAPLAVGTSSLVAAAALLFLVPNPEVDPERLQRRDSATPATETSDSPDAVTEPPSADSEASPDRVEAPEAAAALARLADAPAIEEGDALTQLQAQLVADLTAALGETTFETDLIYQVAMAETGEILGYRAESDPALLAVDATPLPELTYVPVDPEARVDEPVAQFQVTFGADGTVTATPIVSATPRSADPETEEADEAAATAETTAAVDSPPLSADITTEVDDRDRLQAMNDDLYGTLRDARDRREFDTDLVYRVRWTETGELVGFEPDSNTAADEISATPLPELLVLNPPDDDAPQADFRVVFGEDGVLEVSPWNGWPR
jgi:hypothetical protein